MGWVGLLGGVELSYLSLWGRGDSLVPSGIVLIDPGRADFFSDVWEIYFV